MEKKYYYMATDKDMKYRGFQFKVGETYTIGRAKIFENIENSIFSFNNATDRHFLIEMLGDITTEDNKLDSNKIRIVKEINREEVEEHIQEKNSKEAKKLLALFSKNVNYLESLYKEKDYYIRHLVATNINTPKHILVRLSKDPIIDVRNVVLLNPNTPKYLLKEKAKSKESTDRERVAKNSNTSIDILTLLYNDASWYVRLAVVGHPNATLDLLKELTKDKDEYIRKIAEARLKEITQ